MTNARNPLFARVGDYVEYIEPSTGRRVVAFLEAVYDVTGSLTADDREEMAADVKTITTDRSKETP